MHALLRSMDRLNPECRFCHTRYSKGSNCNKKYCRMPMMVIFTIDDGKYVKTTKKVNVW